MRTVLTTLHSKFIHPSLALPYLAAFCGTDCGEIRLREFTVHEPKENVLAALLAEQPQVVAFSVYLWNRRESLELADALALACPEVRVVLGGPEVSFDGPQLFARHPGVSALVRGEGELPLRGLLRAWAAGAEPKGVPRLAWRQGQGVVEGPPGPLLSDLDLIPSPFAAGLVDLRRGCVYYETSRGCPYTCAFCMSALDERVRSFSPARIEADLQLLLAAGVGQVKLVDRTFNYEAARARQIWSFILRQQATTHFHFEIGAHLLDEASLALLATVPPGLFQFEIGVQSTLPGTLDAIGRRVDGERLEYNVRRLRQLGNIHLHLDLIAGLPGEGYGDFLGSIDRVWSLRPHQLQIEPVKLLPGAPLRRDAAALGIRFDPAPPYSVLATPELSFAELERLRGISRLLDLTGNSGRCDGLLEGLATACGSLAAALERVEAFWREQGLFRHPLSQRGVFENLWAFLQTAFAGDRLTILRELLARDFARCERVAPATAPGFFDTRLQPEEIRLVQARVQAVTAAVRGQGVKVQHFAAIFEAGTKRRVSLFLYFTRTGEGMRVEEVLLEPGEG